jgi:hypothetical protein
MKFILNSGLARFMQPIFCTIRLISLSIKGLTVNKFTKKISIAIFALLMASTASAVSITSDLNITGTITFDDDPSNGSLSAVSNATQTATMESILGGSLSTSTVNNVAVTGNNPHGGRLTDINDGIGLNASVSSNGIGFAEAFVFDYNFTLSNSSATEDYTISFAIDYNSSVNSADGAFIDNRLILENPAEFFISDLTTDTDPNNGNEKNGVDTGRDGGVESDSGLFTFDIVVLAGQMAMFTGEIKIDGEVFDPQGLMSALNDSFIYVSAVTGSSPPTQPPIDVPAPSTPLLLLTGLICLIARRIRA